MDVVHLRTSKVNGGGLPDRDNRLVKEPARALRAGNKALTRVLRGRE